MTSRHRPTLLAAGLFALTGVALGAMGAHALEATLTERGMARAWDSAARYQLIHALALLAVGVWMRTASGAASARLVWASRCWTAGILLFSGSLYGLALGGPRWLGPVTPLGGVAFMAGWAWLIAAALAKEE